jgi:hypothetical protein
MHKVETKEFLQWAGSVGVGFHPGYPESRSLTILPANEHARFWGLPEDPAAWETFTASLLGGLADWDTGFLWPRSGAWPRWGQSQYYKSAVRDIVLRGAGIPDGWTGAIGFEREEESCAGGACATVRSQRARETGGG